MRDILFRGKRVDNGEWVYGSLVHRTKYYGDITDKWFVLHGGEFDYDYYDAEEVLSETIGQYSGLNGANDVKIYEGDIIKTTDYFGKQRLFIVCFDNGMFLADTSALRSWLNPISALEVVGNIHDNPDMLTNEGEG